MPLPQVTTATPSGTSTTSKEFSPPLAPSPQKTGARGGKNDDSAVRNEPEVRGLGRSDETGQSSSERLHPVDAFVIDRLDREGLQLAPPADLRVLARRLYLDVIGLPPTVEQVEQFVVAANKNIDEAVSKLVDHYWNHPIRRQVGPTWLDAARYADSHGFQRDDLHEIWAYRDWVIRALNEDMPFDRFTIEQLAGDLLPTPTESQLIATGFNRCAPCNVEAGTDPEENRFNQIVDRVNTLGYAWLGTSLECAQCHDHKYDPFSQKDYYGLFAFFNQTELEADRTNPKVPGSIKFKGPYMAIKDDTTQLKEVELESKIAAAKNAIGDRY